mmetsp:Transcript_63292/g.149040  ORF Transcript_63292/g.149040 Transcript_63292/m.149040 type:complete len:255 (-) Transcript_63292:118-882(-)
MAVAGPHVPPVELAPLAEGADARVDAQQGHRDRHGGRHVIDDLVGVRVQHGLARRQLRLHVLRLRTRGRCAGKAPEVCVPVDGIRNRPLKHRLALLVAHVRAVELPGHPVNHLPRILVARREIQDLPPWVCLRDALEEHPQRSRPERHQVEGYIVFQHDEKVFGWVPQEEFVDRQPVRQRGAHCSRHVVVPKARILGGEPIAYLLRPTILAHESAYRGAWGQLCDASLHDILSGGVNVDVESRYIPLIPRARQW